MKTTKRFENAVTKLYKAFHNDELRAEDCSMCAVGNICDNRSEWMYIIRTNTRQGYFRQEIHPIPNDYLGQIGLKLITNTNYNIKELATVERVFLKHTLNKENKETQFKGLEAVVKYLCQLDDIPNVMDYTSLFEYDNNTPKKELQF